MSEEKSSPIGTLIGVALITGLIGYFIGKPNTTQQETVIGKPNTTQQESEFLKQGLVAYYPFNGNAKDESEEGNHGVVNGATLAADRHGESDQAYSFDGDDDYIDFGKSENFNAYPLTVAVWIKCTNLKVGTSLLGKYVTASWNGWQVSVGDEGRVWPMYLSATGRVIGNHHPTYNENKQFQTSSIPTTRWFHIVLTIDETGGVVFLDGRQEDNKKWSGTAGPPATTAPFSVGDINPTSHPYEGLLDDVRIYNRALSAEEVKALYDLEKPKGK